MARIGARRAAFVRRIPWFLVRLPSFPIVHPHSRDLSQRGPSRQGAPGRVLAALRAAPLPTLLP
jgi:hypothetical protein